MSDHPPRYYAVSSGNGNDGVSQIFFDYAVMTDDPWLLARLAAITTFKAGRGRSWCRKNLHVDGESDYTISATLYDPPGRDGVGFSDHNGAWAIWEIFHWKDSDDNRHSRPVYESLEDAFGAREVATERRRSK